MVKSNTSQVKKLKKQTDRLRTQVWQLKKQLENSNLQRDAIQKTLDSSEKRYDGYQCVIECYLDQILKADYDFEVLEQQSNELRTRVLDLKKELENADFQRDELKSARVQWEEYESLALYYFDQKETSSRDIKELKTILLNFKDKEKFYLLQLDQAYDMTSTLNNEVENQVTEIANLKQQLIRRNCVENIQNFPDELLNQFPKMTDCQLVQETTEDERSFRELAKRMTCKICLLDIERLRCSQCLNGICKNCHTKVASCPHCREEKHNFQPIVIARL